MLSQSSDKTGEFKVVRTGRSIEANQSPKLPLGKVLVVDDDSDFRTQIEMILGVVLSGIELRTFTTPATAIKTALAFAKANPAEGVLVFTDMQMPGLDGATVGAALVGIDNLKVIYWSAAEKPATFIGEVYNKNDFLLVTNPETAPRIRRIVENHFSLEK